MGFLETVCDEPRCDCRRVFVYVVSPRRRDPVAVIAYGWENRRRFYARSMGDGDPSWPRELKAPILNPSSPQSPIAPAVLTLFRKALRSDRAFMSRVKKRYRMFRAEIDGADRFTRRTKRASR